MAGSSLAMSTGDQDLLTENRTQELEISISVMATVSLVFLAARFACKVLLAIYVGTIVAATNHGIGRHINDLPHDEVVRAHYLMGIADAFNIMSIAVSKTSFAVTMLRLSSEIWQKVLIWFTTITMNLLSGLSCVFIFTSCTPFAKVWDNSISSTCMNGLMLIHFYSVTGAWSATTDFILAIFPWALIWGLSMRKAEKFGICVAMSMGILSGITAAVKSSYILQGPKWSDWTCLSIELLIWAGAETAVVITAASIPFLRLALKDATRGRRTTRSCHLEYISNAIADEDLGGGRPISHLKIEASARKHRPDEGSDISILREARSHAILRTHAW